MTGKHGSHDINLAIGRELSFQGFGEDAILAVFSQATAFDSRKGRFTKKKFLNIIKTKDFILITCYANAMENVMKIITDIKEANREAFILCGGPHCNITHEYVEGSFLTCVGEAEGYITQILNSIIFKKSLKGIPGLIYKKNGRVVKNPDIMKVNDLDSSIAPARELADKKKYGHVGTARLEVASIMSTRGCPFNCHFCSHPLNLKKYRQRSIDNVVDEIKGLVQQGYKYLVFYDDNFLLNKKRAYRLMDKIIQEKINVKMALQARANSASANGKGSSLVSNLKHLSKEKTGNDKGYLE